VGRLLVWDSFVLILGSCVLVLDYCILVLSSYVCSSLRLGYCVHMVNVTLHLRKQLINSVIFPELRLLIIRYLLTWAVITNHGFVSRSAVVYSLYSLDIPRLLNSLFPWRIKNV